MQGSHALPVLLSLFSPAPDLLFDCSRVLEYTRIRTVLRSLLGHTSPFLPPSNFHLCLLPGGVPLGIKPASKLSYLGKRSEPWENAQARGRGKGLSSAPRGFAARSCVLVRLVSLAQIGDLARRLLSIGN